MPEGRLSVPLKDKFYMDLSIIIVTHNSCDVIGKCLDSLLENPPSCRFETIIIDNASSDNTLLEIGEITQDIDVVANTSNKGYSRGVNQGINLSAGKMILVLNPDMIVGPDSIDILMKFMRENPEAGMAGSKLMDPDGTVQYSCRSFYTVRALFLRRTFLGKLFPRAKALREHLLMDYDHRETREVDWILGACMMVRRDTVEKIGMMDERFFLYFEDVDWCYRMKQHGWKVFYVPESSMIHLYRRASAGSFFNKPFLIHLLSLFRYYEKWNRFFYFLKRHRPLFKSAAFVLADLAAVNVAFLGAYWARDILDPYFANDLYPMSWYKYFIPFYNLIFFITFLFGKMYRIRRETRGGEELSRITRVVLTGLAVLMASTYLSRIRIYSRAVILGQGFLSVILVFLARRLLRYVHGVFIKAGFDHKRVLLVGEPGEAREFGSSMASNPELGMDIVGYVGEGGDSLGGRDELGEIIERFKIQEIFVLPSEQKVEHLFPMMVGMKFRSVPVRIISPLARFLDRDVSVDNIGGNYLLSLERGPVSRIRMVLVRFMEFIISILIIPFSAAAWLFIKIFSVLAGRPRIYFEERFAPGGRTIRWPRVVYGSQREGSDIFKPYLFFSVLTGRMSLVGPPALPAVSSLRGLEAEDTGIKPGITGKWRTEKTEDHPEALKDEIVELEKHSITNFILVILRSVGKSLTGSYPVWFYGEEVK